MKLFMMLFRQAEFNADEIRFKKARCYCGGIYRRTKTRKFAIKWW